MKKLQYFISAMALTSLVSLNAHAVRSGKQIYEQQCVACHSLSIGEFPNLFSQNGNYLKQTLNFFKKGIRKNKYMQDLMANFSDAEINAVSWYMAKQRSCNIVYDRNPMSGDIRNGRRLTKNCKVCHGPNFRGDRAFSKFMPSIAGQKTEYVVNQLMDFKNGDRNTDGAMVIFAKTLNDDEVVDVAAYLNSLRYCNNN